MNQPPPLEGYDLFTEDRPLAEAVGREGPPDAEARLAAPLAGARVAG